jgi:hypothetical protein
VKRIPVKCLISLLLPLCATTAFGQYVYDYVKSPVVSDTSRWSSNGSPAFTSSGVTFAGAGGSLISIPAISGSNSNDYEVTSTVALKAGGGTYIHFFRTSSGTVQSGSGSYLSAELVIPTGFTSPGFATLNINQSVSGQITQVGSTTVTATDGMTLRTVIWAGNLWIYVNTVPVWFGTVPATTGNPGIGGHGIPSGSGFTSIELGHHDTVAPGTVDATRISSSVFPTSASLSWPGVLDDPNGVGLFVYNLLRNGSIVANSYKPEFVDTTVQASMTYTYTIQAYDWHGNFSQTNFTLSTPPVGTIDPRRTGIYSTGTYWGGGGEQIDTLSGNLHFSIPLASAQGRTGWTVPVNLVYDSQNWRQDNGVNWQLGTDVGYGFGWKLLIGSVTPFYTGYYSGVDHYIYTDGTGAQYRLDQSNGGVWTSSKQGGLRLVRRKRQQPAFQGRVVLDDGQHFRRHGAGRRDHVSHDY